MKGNQDLEECHTFEGSVMYLLILFSSIKLRYSYYHTLFSFLLDSYVHDTIILSILTHIIIA